MPNLLLLFYLFFIPKCYCEETLVVETDIGLIRGELRSYDGTEFRSFRGVPFAEPPLGKLRFKPPVPKTPWSGIRDAYAHGPVCMQDASDPKDITIMSEDCLYLNVYVPKKDAARPLPVYFFVHGGEFRRGFSDELDFGPHYLMAYDVILVTTNYRVGSFGFISLNIPAATGNNGIKDVLLALTWTKNNIAKFGGNPDLITIGGFSAGSGLVNYAQLIQQFDGLYQRVILESGSALGFRYFDEDPVKTATDFSKLICDSTSSREEILDCLLDQEASDLLNAQIAMGDHDKMWGFRSYAPFVPSIEIESDHRVLKEKPLDILRKGLNQKVPILAGINCEEGLKFAKKMRTNMTQIELLNEDNTRYVPTDLNRLNDSQLQDLANRIQDFYFDGGNITDEHPDQYFDLITDTHYGHAVNYWLELYKKQPDSGPVFYYQFCFDGAFNFFKYRDEVTYPGATHGDQVPYIFHTKETETFRESADEISIHRQNTMLEMWTDFIKLGNPTPPGSYVMWKPSEYPVMNHFYISDYMKNIFEKPFSHRSKFWKDIYDAYYLMYDDWDTCS